MESTRKAILQSSITRYSMVILNMLSVILVSRLLTPSEIGTFAIASSIIIIMTEFRMLGAGGYLIREKELTDEKVRTALGLTILISWGLGIIVITAAYPVTVFYDIPGLNNVFYILSIGFFIAPFSSIVFALLTRKMDFKVQMYVRLFSSIISFFLTITLIYFGFSFYSLAIGFTAMEIFTLIGLLFSWPKDMRLLPKFGNMRPVVSFGIYNSLSSFTRSSVATLPDIIIGKLGNTVQVAMFSRGMGFIEFIFKTPASGVVPVALPYLSATCKENYDSLCTVYTKASVLLGAIVCPALGVASFISLPAIRLFFGDQWDNAAPLASVLAYWAIFRSIHWFAFQLFLALGKEKLLLLKESIPFLFLLPSLIIAYPYGLIYLAIVFVISGIIDFIFCSVLLIKYVDLNILSFFQAWRSNILITMICMFCTWLISIFVPFDSENYFFPIIVVSVLLPVIWYFSLWFTRNPLFLELNGLIRK